ncbi:MAG: ribonuclease HI [Pseudomonadota bacterium]
MAENNTISLYTDGACSGNPGPGGWGALLKWNGHEKELSGGEDDTTNNRMEMMAVIEGLKAIKKEGADVHIYTDSKYVMDGVTQWLEGWKAKGWKTAAKKPVKNEDLWREIDSLIRVHNVNFTWVKGHAGHPENEYVDKLAVSAIPKT